MDHASSVVAITIILVTGLLHSVLGERFIIGPLLARAQLGTFSGRTMRAAWHITSVAWWAMAAVVGWPDQAALWVAVGLGVSGVLLFVGTRGAHFAWPLFMIAAYASTSSARGAWLFADGSARAVIAPALTVVLGAIALLHAYWVLGGTWGLGAAVPTRKDGGRVFTPGRGATVVVVLGLSAFAALPWLVDRAPGARAALALAAAIFGLRVLGDLRTAGVLKRVRGTPFARADDLVYTPLCLALSAGLGLLAAG